MILELSCACTGLILTPASPARFKCTSRRLQTWGSRFTRILPITSCKAAQAPGESAERTQPFRDISATALLPAHLSSSCSTLLVVTSSEGCVCPPNPPASRQNQGYSPGDLLHQVLRLVELMGKHLPACHPPSTLTLLSETACRCLTGRGVLLGTGKKRGAAHP